MRRCTATNGCAASRLHRRRVGDAGGTAVVVTAPVVVAVVTVIMLIIAL